ncbi:MAG: alpha/beta hydrolase [Rhodospirillales bacterium]|nr:MAG: alpha/beta hydrolase [Rhodospirillales bacterium]
MAARIAISLVAVLAAVLMATLIEFEGTPVASTAEGAAPAAVPAVVRDTYVAADRYGFLTAADGAKLRFGVWTAKATPARGSILLLTGRGEFIDKYAVDIVPTLLARGFAVYAMDWRGQGLSARLVEDRQKGHIDSFDTYLSDLKAFIATVVEPEAPRPVVGLTHSMGGNVLLRYLAETGPESKVAAAVFGAPMTGLRREAIISTMLMLLPSVPQVDERFFYGSAPFQLIGREFIGNKVTHDERRFRFTEAWFAADPRLSLGGPTVGWLRQATRSIRALDAPGVPERIAVPTLVFSAGQDLLVDSKTHAAICERIPGCALIPYPDARHEIMMETDAIRARLFRDLDPFLDRVAPKR